MLQKMKAIATDVTHPSATSIASKAYKFLAAFLALALGLSVVIYAMHVIRVNDGRDTYVMTTVFDTPQGAAKKVADGHDYKVKSVTKGLYSTDVVISYYFPLTVTMNNKTETYSVASGRLDDILYSIGISVDKYDIVTPSLDTYVTESCAVDIVDVEYKTEIATEEIPYGNVVEYSDRYYNNTQLSEPGVNGQKLVTRSVKYVNGVATDSAVLDEQTLKAAISSKTIIGTKVGSSTSSIKTISTLKAPSNLVLDENGIPVNYKSSKTLRATAYTHTGHNCSTGVKPQPGYVAVDPKEIPYGTKMYIVSSDGKYVYGYAIAADTGGFIHGDRTDMDLFMDTRGQCINFGRRNITVYFL